MSRKSDYSKKILKTLAEKPALPVAELMSRIAPKDGLKEPKYAIARSLRGLMESGLVESRDSGQQLYTRLTKQGRIKASSQKLDGSSSLLNPSWDGKWRIVILDVPEERKAERESLRYLLKKAGFACLKNSVWISPLPYEYLFANIKKDFELTTELMIFVTDTIDAETEKAFFDQTKKAV